MGGNLVPASQCGIMHTSPTVADIARDFHYSDRHIRRLLAEGKIPGDRAHPTGRWRPSGKLLRRIRERVKVTRSV